MISIVVVMTLMGTYGPEEQESCLLEEVCAFELQSFLGMSWKNVCVIFVYLDGFFAEEAVDTRAVTR
jgi:hypothetical protein